MKISKKNYLKIYFIFSQTDSKVSLNGQILSATALKNRPRIPTPDVTKEAPDFRPGFPTNIVNPTTVASGVALMTHQVKL
jgi:hypothetical protein